MERERERERERKNERKKSRETEMGKRERDGGRKMFREVETEREKGRQCRGLKTILFSFLPFFLISFSSSSHLYTPTNFI